MPKYPKDLFDMPPAQAVLALGDVLLGEAGTARTRLHDTADEEALHDFRVAIRRLRSVLRAFRPYVEHAVTRKLRGRLRDLARATNSARDAEVHVSWVEERRGRLTPSERVGAKWFLERMTEKRDQAYEVSVQVAEREFPRLERRVSKALHAAATDPAVATDEPPSFALALEELIHDHAMTLDQRLDAIQGPDDEDRAHAARISAKRLRYLLELVERDLKPARSAVASLRKLQTILGELHDAQVVGVEFAAACEVAAAEHARRLSALDRARHRDERERRRIRRRNATGGMLALVRLCRESHDELFQQYTKWRATAFPTLTKDVDAVLAELRTHVPADLIEVERKYLLRAMPALPATATSQEIDQGWIPGERLLERLRRIATGEGEQYFRTVKAGSGVTRIEIEEATSAEVFQQLWPLTEGRRVRKRRHRVPHETFTWEIDEFLDRELFLAEVELPAPTAVVAVPEWLDAVLVREVTGEAEYVNVNLAR